MESVSETESLDDASTPTTPDVVEESKPVCRRELSQLRRARMERLGMCRTISPSEGDRLREEMLAIFVPDLGELAPSSPPA